ncbi:cytochrome b-like, partial [Protobothrops mucrosquamatus]|uniref:cytochrome b-like n=1 Tax=Protobothrops mucrosquamatus TaxID=103944 RepID=UPI000775BB36
VSSKAINLVKGHLQSYPCPVNLNFMWNFGFLIAVAIMLQIISGVLLASIFTAEITLAYNSVQYMIREIGSGWLFRYVHATAASFVFIFSYIHIIRAISFGSCYYLSLTWLSGLVMFILTIVTAFLGYVLPWGQMSFWAATVITNLLSSIPFLVSWLCGGYYVSNPTLKRFFVLHFILPFVILGLILIHILYLHLTGSNNPLGIDTPNKVTFYPTILWLDLKGLSTFVVILSIQVFIGIVTLSHPDNSCVVDRFVTPLQIVPEWYFLPFYAMLKSIPHKTSGLIVMICSIQCIYMLAEQRHVNTNIQIRSTHGRSIMSMSFWLYSCLYSLIWVGSQLPQCTYLSYGRIFVISYFSSGVRMIALENQNYYNYTFTLH